MEVHKTMKRDTKCSDCGEAKIGQEVCVAGWVNVRRDLGGLIFVELRDPTGKLQLVADPNINKDAHQIFSGLRSEYVIIAKGKLTKRPEGTQKADQTSGTVELYPSEVALLNTAAAQAGCAKRLQSPSAGSAGCCPCPLREHAAAKHGRRFERPA